MHRVWDCINACPVKCFEMSDSKNLPYRSSYKAGVSMPVAYLQKFYGNQLAA